MDGRTLLQIISKDEKAKQFWEKFSGKDILDELFKHPELLGMQDTKYTTATEEEKCMFSVNTENGFKFEKEERVFDSFYEKLGQYVKIILKQKLIVALEERMCIFRKNRALAPHERSAVPLGTDHCPVC